VARKSHQLDPASEAYYAGVKMVSDHPLFDPLIGRLRIVRTDRMPYPRNGWADAGSSGVIYCHPTRRGTAEEWAYVIAHLALHFGFGHFREGVARHDLWVLACDAFVTKFLDSLKFGCPPAEMAHNPLLNLPSSEQILYDQMTEVGVPDELKFLGAAGDNVPDMKFEARVEKVSRYSHAKQESWEDLLVRGMRRAVSDAVQVAGGHKDRLGGKDAVRTKAQIAKSWFIDSYPLIGGVATVFRIVEDVQICQSLGIPIAAVDIADETIYFNPLANLSQAETIFVMAHEILHAALRHDIRCMGRDFELWNVACDFVINHWLYEMEVGTMPAGLLFDPVLKDLSAEEIYDRLCTDLRRARKLITLRGCHGGDMIGNSFGGVPVDLDAFYRRALMQGLEYHQCQGRGFLPAGLIEEIRTLAQPPVPWDVELGHWFDDHFAPLDKVRTYRRLSRRQEATPDIPRPSMRYEDGALDGRTFGAVLDTSASVERTMLGKAIGVVASYATAKDVSQIRVVFCDARPYDEGYVDVASLAHRVRVRGRGGTVLQPGIDLLEAAKDFPKDAPIMVISDGDTDVLSIRREHCLVIPSWAKLPFQPRGKVFRVPWKKPD
jgi:predicted metal-dependent peptidase